MTMMMPTRTNRPRLPSVRTEAFCCRQRQQSQRLGPRDTCPDGPGGQRDRGSERRVWSEPNWPPLPHARPPPATMDACPLVRTCACGECERVAERACSFPAHFPGRLCGRSATTLDGRDRETPNSQSKILNTSGRLNLERARQQNTLASKPRHLVVPVAELLEQA